MGGTWRQIAAATEVQTMTKLENTIAWLKDFRDYFRGRTRPGYNIEFYGCNVVDKFDDALELLKEQEPRMLTLEEVRERKPFHLWVEDLETGAQVFPIAYVGGLYVDSAEDWSVDPDHRNTPEYYGKTWRCWTAKPTYEQRRAVKWE